MDKVKGRSVSPLARPKSGRTPQVIPTLKFVQLLPPPVCSRRDISVDKGRGIVDDGGEDEGEGGGVRVLPTAWAPSHVL